jgi:hypothetical protein
VIQKIAPSPIKGVGEAVGDSGVKKNSLKGLLASRFRNLPAEFRDVSSLEGLNEPSCGKFQTVAQSFRNDYKKDPKKRVVEHKVSNS